MGVLPAVADLVLKTGLWFLVTGIVLYLVARAYVSALLSLRSRSGISKLAGGVALTDVSYTEFVTFGRQGSTVKTPNHALEPTAASGLRRLATLSALCALAAAQCER